MTPTYYATPAGPCLHAAAKSFSDADDARRHAQEAADAHRVGYVVFRVLAGRPRRLAAYSPTTPTRKESR